MTVLQARKALLQKVETAIGRMEAELTETDF